MNSLIISELSLKYQIEKVGSSHGPRPLLMSPGWFGTVVHCNVVYKYVGSQGGALILRLKMV